MKPKLILSLLTLMLCMSVFCVPALASADHDAERLSVSTAWTDGEVLHIEVLDNQTGVSSAIELRLAIMPITHKTSLYRRLMLTATSPAL